MVSFFRSVSIHSSRRATAIILAFAILLGLVFGAYFAVLCSPSDFSLMLAAAGCSVSIVGIAAALLLPVSFTAFAVYTSHTWILIPAAFAKAFVFCFLSTGCVLLAGNSGWLIRLLLMFTDILSLPVLIWLWFHICLNKGSANLRCLSFVFMILCGIGFLDFQFISPFLVNLIS